MIGWKDDFCCLVPGVGPRKHEAQGYTYLRRGNIHFMSAREANSAEIRNPPDRPSGNGDGDLRRCNEKLLRSYSQASDDSTTILGTATLCTLGHARKGALEVT